MRMRILGRDDPLLFAGLTFALLVVFQRSIQQALNAAHDVEQTYGVALMPALLILTVMFVFHQYGKRREMKAEATAASIEAALATARAAEMEQLMLFGQELARSLSIEALREAVWRHLSALAGGREAWLVVRTDAGWERITDTTAARWPAGAIERIADRAAVGPVSDQERSLGINCEGHLCFVMLADTRPSAVLALAPGPATRTAPQTMAAAATLLSIALRNAQLFAKVRDHGVKDGLTGCFNRTHAFDVLDAEVARSRRMRTPLSIVLFDVDHFKNINDQYGHLCGDRVLAAVGQRMGQVLRRSDVRCRYGGDEFLVVLPETPASGAMRVAESLRSEMEQLDLTADGERMPLTISAGIATAVGGDTTAAALIDRADEALYSAKHAGRNRVGSTGLPFGDVRGYGAAAAAS